MCRGTQSSLQQLQGCSAEFRATVWSNPEGILHIRALWGSVQGLGGGEGAERVQSSLARWVTAFKGFLERFRTAECSEGFGREKGKPRMSSLGAQPKCRTTAWPRPSLPKLRRAAGHPGGDKATSKDPSPHLDSQGQVPPGSHLQGLAKEEVLAPLALWDPARSSLPHPHPPNIRAPVRAKVFPPRPAPRGSNTRML